MRILLIDVNCKNSSTGKIVYDLYKKINSTGHCAAICYGRGKKIEEKNIYKFGIDLETIFHVIMTRLTGLTGCYSFFSTRKLLKYMQDFKPDVVHIHELHAYFVDLKPLTSYLKKKKIKTIWTFHCEFMYTGKCGHAYECEKWKTECGSCPYKNDYPSSLFFDFTKKMFLDKKRIFEGFDNLIIVTPSEWLADRVRKSFLKNKKIVVIQNGINCDEFYLKDAESLKRKLKIPSNNKVVLSAAPDIFSERKGGKYILQLAKKMDKMNITFILIGCRKGESTLGSDKEKESKLIVLEPINVPDILAEFYSMADIFVLCSEKETFSMTCAEALCCGTKVVGFKCGAPEMIFEEPYAKFVEYGNINELMNVIDKTLSIFSEKGLTEAYGKENFSCEKVLFKYMDYYTNKIDDL